MVDIVDAAEAEVVSRRAAGFAMILIADETLHLRQRTVSV
jgi:hypothetical protein